MKKTATKTKTKTASKKTTTKTKTASKKAASKAKPGSKAKAGSRVKPASPGTTTASRKIDARIAELGDWRGKLLARIRAVIAQADPGVIEEWKWGWTPVWSHDGIICTGETYQSHVKMTFARGASLPDPARLFNASLDGNVRRAIDLHEGDRLDAKALKALVRAGVALNQRKAKGKTKPRR